MATVTDTGMPARFARHNIAWRVVLLAIVTTNTCFPVFAATWTITPSITVNETATDNVGLSESNQQSELITDISPGIRVDALGGRSKLHFDYQLHNLLYAQDASRNRTQNSLNALGTLEAVDNWLFIDASGFISQQNISAFGSTTSTAVNTNTNSNTTETSTYSISPYIQGSFGTVADYQLRYRATDTSTRSGQAFDSQTRQWTGNLKGQTGLTNLGWSLDANSQTATFNNGRSNNDDRLRGTLIYQFDPQFRVSLLGGRESNDYLSANKKSYTTKGAGFEWAPTERTLISANREERFFGTSNTFSVSHRTALTAWSFKQSKDASVQNNQQTGVGTLYEQFASQCDLIANEQAKISCFALARAQADAIGPGGFLTAGVTLQQRRELSVALLGARNTVTFAASQSHSESLSQGAGTGFLIGTNFTNANAIQQRVESINWSHKLTEISSLTGVFSHIRSNSSGGTDNIHTTQQSASLNFTTQLGPKTNAGIGARRVVVNGETSYTENALTGVLTHQF